MKKLNWIEVPLNVKRGTFPSINRLPDPNLSAETARLTAHFPPLLKKRENACFLINTFVHSPVERRSLPCLTFVRCLLQQEERVRRAFVIDTQSCFLDNARL